MSENQDIDWKGFKKTSLELREVSNPNLNLYNDYKTDLIKYINNSESSVFNESKIKKYYFRKSVYFWSNSQIWRIFFKSTNIKATAILLHCETSKKAIKSDKSWNKRPLKLSDLSCGDFFRREYLHQNRTFQNCNCR